LRNFTETLEEVEQSLELNVYIQPSI